MAKIVVALGGNALGNTPKEQEEIVKVTAKTIVDIVEKGNQVVVVHGNGPQVGMISLAFDEGIKVNKKIPNMPLSLAVAMSQGYIGLHLQQAINNELNLRKIKDKKAFTLVSQVEVKANDPSFKDPSKPIGLFYSEEEAKALAKSENWVVKEDSGRGWRRMVPSPKPISILEKTQIEKIIKEDNVVVAGGGGGIPTIINPDGTNTIIDAVIDKDYTAAKIAVEIDADVLMIITATDGIFVNFGTPEAKKLSNPTTEELEKLLGEGEYPEGSMAPKVRAVVNFVKSKKGRKACITEPTKAKETLDNKAGSWVIK